MRRLRDFAGIVAMLSDREIDEMQAAIDARREARATQAQPTGPVGRGVTLPAPQRVQRHEGNPTEQGEG